MPNFNIWEAYYMDNDGRKKVIGRNLSYSEAERKRQKYATLYNIYVFIEAKGGANV